MMKYVDAALCFCCGCHFRHYSVFQPVQTQSFVHSEVVGQAAAEILAEDQADPRLAAKHRLALPEMRDRGRENRSSAASEWTQLINEKVGEIKAQIIERDGEVWMVKDCPHHGTSKT